MCIRTKKLCENNRNEINEKHLRKQMLFLFRVEATCFWMN